MARILITGANQGIGLELVRQFASRGDDVIGVCRHASDELRAVGCELIEGVDVTDQVSIDRMADSVGDRVLDVVVNNAGILSHETLNDLDFDRMKKQYDVNALGPLRVTKALENNLAAGSKLAIVTSRVGSMDDNSSGGNYGYRMSKAAANMAGVNLAIDFKPRGIAVVLLHPGYVRTNMTGGNGLIDAQTSAAGLVAQIDGLDMEKTGTFWHGEGYELPW